MSTFFLAQTEPDTWVTIVENETTIRVQVKDKATGQVKEDASLIFEDPKVREIALQVIDLPMEEYIYFRDSKMPVYKSAKAVLEHLHKQYTTICS